MEAFYVCIIFLGVLLVIVALFFIAMDRVNGKDFFKEFDRKKDEMFNMIQDSEEMVHELNRMSDYVVAVISEKNKEFLSNSINNSQESSIKEIETNNKESEASVDQEDIELFNSDQISEYIINKEQKPEELVNEKQMLPIEFESQVQEELASEKDENIVQTTKAEESESQIGEINTHRRINTQFTYNSPLYQRDSTGTGSKLSLNSSRKEVLQLIEQGLSNDEIADKLKIGKGEIGLIRGLINR